MVLHITYIDTLMHRVCGMLLAAALLWCMAHGSTAQPIVELPLTDGFCSWQGGDQLPLTLHGDTSSCTKCRSGCAAEPLCTAYQWGANSFADSSNTSACQDATPPSDGPSPQPQAASCAWFDRNQSPIPSSANNTVNCSSCQALCSADTTCFYYAWNGADRAMFNSSAPCTASCAHYNRDQSPLALRNEANNCSSCQSQCAIDITCFYYSWRGGLLTRYGDAACGSTPTPTPTPGPTPNPTFVPRPTPAPRPAPAPRPPQPTSTPTPTADAADGQLRLFGGNATNGRLEIYSASLGFWGTVCDDNFDYHAAVIACRQLWLPTSGATWDTIPASNFYGTPPDDPNSDNNGILLDGFTCNGTESSLMQCASSFPTTNNCGHDEDVVLTCADIGGGYACMADAEVQGTIVRANWAPDALTCTALCDAQGGADADTACDFVVLQDTTCNLMNNMFSGPNLTTSPSPGALTCIKAKDGDPAGFACGPPGVNWAGTNLLHSYNENGSSADCAAQCSVTPNCTFYVYGDGNCYLKRDFLVGSGSDTGPDSSVEAACFTMRALDPNGQLRLFGGNATGGRLEIYSADHGFWGTICDDNFDVNAAVVACRQLGLPTGAVTFETVPSEQFYGAPPSDPTGATNGILLDNFACTGNETALIQCDLHGVTFPTDNNCVHAEDVALNCAGATPTPTPTAPTPAPTTAPTAAPPTDTTGAPADGDLRLYGGNTTSGRLETYSTTQSRWGTVCDDNFDDVAARVACRQLGLPAANATWGTVDSASEYGAPPSDTPSSGTFFDGYNCRGGEARLIQCASGAFPTSEDCDHSEDVALFCQSPADGDVRLFGGNTTSGRLEMYSTTQSRWGTVCDDNFDEYAARVVCRQVGFSTANATWRTVSDSSEFGPPPSDTPNDGTFFDGYDCSGDEVRLIQCINATFPTNNDCSHAEDVAVFCQP